ncbi:MAG: membrane protein YqaA with SNARE-associated domain [Myxococcota bacterium]|jgi:membrane protein YqaA with SNARE-associated domain
MNLRTLILSKLILLFSVSFLAATILPAQSELVLVSLKNAGDNNTYLLALVATIGNVLGSLVNFIIGRYLLHFKHKKWFPISAKMLKKTTNIYQKWGFWSLLLAWVPFIGDPLTLIAGTFRTNIWLFLSLVTIGKSARYIAIIAIF